MKAPGPLMMITAAMLAAATPALAACPRDAVLASLDIWPKGAVLVGETVTGRHTCGRRIRCTGGDYRQDLERRCRWL